MKLKVKLFATLRAKYPQVSDLNPLEVEVEDGITVEQLVEQLGLPKEQVQLIYINGMRADLSTSITKEATIALFPALGGG
ncbi:MAG: MoaD/ThiS family protein [Candidatus Heimdallarchaeaceae archaeon]